MLSTCPLSDVLQVEGCLADSDVDAMVCMWTQDDGWILQREEAVSGVATHQSIWRMRSISCLVAQLTVMPSLQ